MMDKSSTIQAASRFLADSQIGFDEPAQVVRLGDHFAEVIFPVPGTSDPGVVVDPPDVRVQIDLRDGSASLVPQM